MLVLSVPEGHKVTLTLPNGEEIVVTVMRSREIPRIGFEAPRNVHILRDNARAHYPKPKEK